MAAGGLRQNYRRKRQAGLFVKFCSGEVRFWNAAGSVFRRIIPGAVPRAGFRDCRRTLWRLEARI